jgi:hypothetical protein
MAIGFCPAPKLFVQKMPLIVVSKANPMRRPPAHDPEDRFSKSEIRGLSRSGRDRAKKEAPSILNHRSASAFLIRTSKILVKARPPTVNVRNFLDFRRKAKSGVKKLRVMRRRRG